MAEDTSEARKNRVDWAKYQKLLAVVIPLAYLYFSAIGLIYVDEFYGRFNINIFDFSEPSDFLLIAYSKAGIWLDTLLMSLVAIPLTALIFVVTLVVLLIALYVLALALIFLGLIFLAALNLMIVFIRLLGLLVMSVLTFRMPAPEDLREIAEDIAGKREKHKKHKEIVKKLCKTLFDVLWKLVVWMWRRHIHFVCIVLLLSVLFPLYLAHAQAGRDYRSISEAAASYGQTNQAGQVNADDAQFLCRMMGRLPALPELVLLGVEKVLSISCSSVHEEQLQYVRVIVRPSAGNPFTHLPSCLVRLGATSGFHFFYEQESGKRFTVPADNMASVAFLPPKSECPQAQSVEFAPACHLEKLEDVKGFPEVEHQFKQETQDINLKPLFGKMECRFYGHTLEQLLLIGRADLRDILPREKRKLYGSNSGLAQARAKWVKTKLYERFPGKIDPGRTVLLSAGPLYINDDGQDEQDGQDEDNERHASNRVVEVYACWAPKPARSEEPG